MAARVGAHDWAATPLGPREQWSPSLRLIVDTIMASQFPMALRWGPEFVVIYNDGYLPILGEKHPQALGARFREIWPEVQDQLGSLHQDLLSGKRKAVFAEDMLLRIRATASAFEDAYFTVSYSPVPDETAPTGIGGVLITAVETTERLRVERALRESEERLQFALDAGGGIGTWDWDIKSGLVHSDSRFASLYSVDPARAAKGAPITDFVAGVHPQDREWVTQRIEAALSSAGEFAEEYRLLQKDGSVRWIFARGRARNDAEGRPHRFPGVVFDITDRKMAEMALREREAELARVQEIGQVGGVEVFLTDGFKNRRSPEYLKIHGLPPEAWNETHEDWVRRIHPEDREKNEQAFIRAVRGDAHEYRAEYRIIRPSDGEVRWIQVRSRDRARCGRASAAACWRAYRRHRAQAGRRCAAAAQRNPRAAGRASARASATGSGVSPMISSAWRTSRTIGSSVNPAATRDSWLERAGTARHADRLAVASGRCRRRRSPSAGS